MVKVRRLTAARLRKIPVGAMPSLHGFVPPHFSLSSAKKHHLPPER